ncbi:DUF4190 domain-containing protein [Fodinicola feengrottensis]|nr:DUF4190 domain-containing protein [Fodinicola feengrottensis]
MAVLALVFSFVFAPVGIFLGYRAKKEIARTGEDGDGLATAGIIVGWVHCGIWALVFLIWIAFIVLYVVFAISLVGAAGAAGSTNALFF